MDYEVIIVGGGPAGISTALHLARYFPELARRTLVLEKSRHPRPKLCAGGILPDGDCILRRLGLNPDEVRRVKTGEAYFQFEGRGICIKRDPVSFTVVRREEFDAWLAGKARDAGIRIIEETSVLRVEPSGAGVTVVTGKGEFRSRVVVGADGTNSVVRRAVTRKVEGNMAMTLEIFLTPDQLKKTDHRPMHAAYFDFSSIANKVQGYIWDFPTQSDGQPTRNRGIFDARVYRDTLFPNLKTQLQPALKNEGINLADFHLQGFSIRGFDPEGTFSAPGILLVGDAAGVDMIFGEGISFALGYGELAAREIAGAFQTNDFTFAAYRNRILRSPMGRCLIRRVNVARLLYGMRKPWMQKFLWWRFGWLMKWYIEHYLIDWALQDSERRIEEKKTFYRQD